MAADGSIVIETNVDAKQAQTELNRIAKKIEGLQDKVKRASSERLPWAEQANELEARLDAAKAKLYEMENAASGIHTAEQLAEQKENVKSLQARWEEALRAVTRYDNVINKANADIGAESQRAGNLAQQLAGFTQQSEEAEEAVGDIGEEATESFGEAEEAGESAGSLILMTFREAAQEIATGIVAGLKVAYRAAEALWEAFKKIAKASLEVGKKVVSAASSLNVVKRISDKIMPSLKRIINLAKRAFIFNTISAGFRYLKSQISLYLSTNEELTSALANLKGAFLTAFNPIFEAVIPALTALVESLTRVLAAVASLTSMLFGKTAKQAKDNAEALNKQAQATKGAGKAAKEASKQLAAFDQLNVLNDNEAAEGGGVEVPEVSFDFEVDTKQWDSWGEALSEFMDRIILKLPDFSDALESFKDKINGFAVNVKDMLVFDGLLDKVKTIGSTLGTTISNWFKDLDWKSLGTAFGAGLNILITLLDNFVNNVDWKGIGASIATFLNNTISEIDWEAVGRLFFAGVKIGILVLAGLIENADMEQVGQAITSFVQGFAQAVSETIEAVDWKKIGEQVRDLFCAIDWAAVAEAVFTVLGEAFAAAALFLWGLLEEAWNKVVQWWHEHAIEDGKFTLRGFLEGIGEAILGIANWIKEHVLDPFIKGFKKVFGIASPSKVMAEMGRYVIDGLKEGITSRISSVLEGIKKLFKAIKDWYETNVKPKLTVEYWKDQFSGISDGLKSVLNGILGFVETCINWIVDKLNGISIDVPSWAANILGISSIGFSIPRVSIPRLAQGAVIPPNREFMAVLGDQKHGTNIEAPLETIVAAFKQAMSEYGGGSFNFYLDGDPIYAKVERRRSQMARAGGR